MHTPNIRIGERHVRPRKAFLELLLVIQRRKSDGSRVFAASALLGEQGRFCSGLIELESKLPEKTPCPLKRWG